MQGAVCKVVLLGESGVGKTCLSRSFVQSQPSLESDATIGASFAIKDVVVQGQSLKLHIWDTAGQERYKSITNAYYKGAKGALLVFDLTRKETFDSVDRWIPDLRASGDENVTILLIGNKCDLTENRQVSEEEARNKAQLYSKEL